MPSDGCFDVKSAVASWYSQLSFTDCDCYKYNFINKPETSLASTPCICFSNINGLLNRNHNLVFSKNRAILVPPTSYENPYSRSKRPLPVALEPKVEEKSRNHAKKRLKEFLTSRYSKTAPTFIDHNSEENAYLYMNGRIFEFAHFSKMTVHGIALKLKKALQVLSESAKGIRYKEVSL